MNRIVSFIRGLAAPVLTAEGYTYLLLAIGLPLVAYLYSGWKAAIATFVIPQLLIGLLALRGR